MAVHEVLFPTEISYGSRGGPGFNTAIVETAGGGEQRSARWETSRRVYDVRWGLKTLDHLVELQTFFQARRGATFGFRYRDPLDRTSALNGRDAPTNADQTIDTGDAVATQFQLRKTYPSGPSEGVSVVRRPVSGTVVVAIDSVAQTEGVDFTVDVTTGVLTFASAPADGATITAGFEMDWPCRFGEQVDRALQASVDFYDSGSMESIEVIEVRDEAGAWEDGYAGGDLDIENLAGAPVQLSRHYVSVRVRQTDGATDLLLPDPTLDTGENIQPGGVHWFIFNHDATNSIEVRDHGGNLVATIGPGDGKSIVLGAQEDDTAIERWLLLDTASGITPLPSPWSGADDDLLLLGADAIAEGFYTETVGAGGAGDVGWITPATEPGTVTWDDVGHTLVLDISADPGGSGISSAVARMFHVSADGLTVHQFGNGSPSQSMVSAGIYSFAIPATTWTTTPLITDRFAVGIAWQAAFDPTNKTLSVRTGTGTSYVDSSITNFPPLKQWMAF